MSKATRITATILGGKQEFEVDPGDTPKTILEAEELSGWAWNCLLARICNGELVAMYVPLGQVLFPGDHIHLSQSVKNGLTVAA